MRVCIIMTTSGQVDKSAKLMVFKKWFRKLEEEQEEQEDEEEGESEGEAEEGGR